MIHLVGATVTFSYGFSGQTAHHVRGHFAKYSGVGADLGVLLLRYWVSFVVDFECVGDDWLLLRATDQHKTNGQ